jgi:hypothetical protein
MKCLVLIIVFFLSFQVEARNWKDYSKKNIETLIDEAFGIKLGYPINSQANSKVKIISDETTEEHIYPELIVKPPKPSPYFNKYTILVTNYNGYVLTVDAFSDGAKLPICNEFIGEVGTILKRKYSSLEPKYTSFFGESNYGTGTWYLLMEPESRKYYSIGSTTGTGTLIEIFCNAREAWARFSFKLFSDETMFSILDEERELYLLENKKTDTAGFE